MLRTWELNGLARQGTGTGQLLATAGLGEAEGAARALGTGGKGEHKGLGILTDWRDKARAQGHDYQSTIIISKLLLMLSSPFLENPPHLKGYQDHLGQHGETVSTKNTKISW